MARKSRDEKWMRRALQLARRGEGRTRPNPPVGAVLVDRKGKLLAEAWHKRAGAPHAEPQVLQKAGKKASGGTLYVSLEPCNTQGRTPPCTDAIIAAGLQRVVVACRDPNPKHHGAGLRKLKRHGIEVTVGVCKEDAESLIEPFTYWISNGAPFVTLKLGQSLDGRIADPKRQSRWITGEAARKEVQALRRRADAILVGSGTIRADNPSLLPRPSKGRTPFRIIVSSTCNLSPKLTCFADGHQDQTLVFTTKRAASIRRAALGRTGAEVIVVPEKGGQPSLRAMLRTLGQRGILHLLCEGGGSLAAGLVKQQLVNEAQLFVAPTWLGSEGSVASVQGVSWPLGQAPRWQTQEARQVGNDVLIRVRPEEK